MTASNVRPSYDPWTNGDPGSGGSRDDDDDSALLDVGQIRQQQRRMIDGL